MARRSKNVVCENTMHCNWTQKLARKREHIQPTKWLTYFSILIDWKICLHICSSSSSFFSSTLAFLFTSNFRRLLFTSLYDEKKSNTKNNRKSYFIHANSKHTHTKCVKCSVISKSDTNVVRVIGSLICILDYIHNTFFTVRYTRWNNIKLKMANRHRVCVRVRDALTKQL